MSKKLSKLTNALDVADDWSAITAKFYSLIENTIHYRKKGLLSPTMESLKDIEPDWDEFKSTTSRLEGEILERFPRIREAIFTRVYDLISKIYECPDPTRINFEPLKYKLLVANRWQQKFSYRQSLAYHKNYDRNKPMPCRVVFKMLMEEHKGKKTTYRAFYNWVKKNNLLTTEGGRGRGNNSTITYQNGLKYFCRTKVISRKV